MTTNPAPHRSRGDGARWSDEQVDRFIGSLLRAGVILAATVGAVGGALYLARHGLDSVSYREFRGQPPALRQVAGIVAGMIALDARAIIQLGLLLLIATPVARVAFAVVAFILQRDRVYVVITSVVLALLLLSLSGAVPV